ncbi:hypothetical protein F4813DRAFT_351133 [Daldinia decipiens]|uniref:uncharacterized protein n=1 Tax=Daldinia decipiens TaxID=326647 RepID=UPI0020C3350B|nr:uncharacterized protein F4813DRAFT_351133 [Daldinia decipiens]KAI1660152.1 hypothetical protein F4813DRAFT_351133 [Daldinia decipiens]
MAAKDVQLHAAFGDNDFFREAFNYNLSDIEQWLNDCVAGKKGGDQTKKEEVRKKLLGIKGKLFSLMVPNGCQFVNPSAKPNSHFPRRVRVNWLEDKDPVKFNLLCWAIEHQGALDKSLESKWANPYDLLGLFISSLGPAPTTADKNNYFLPLAAVYGRWCSRIAGHAHWRWGWKTRGNGAGDWPYMFQVTWKLVKAPVDKKRPAGKTPPADYKVFFLGSSMAGDDWVENPQYEDKYTGKWRRAVQRSRFNWLYHGLQLKKFTLNDFDSSPVQINKETSSNQPYGNCAETYPFIFSIRSNASSDNKDLMGLALQRDYMMDEDLKTYNHDDVSAYLCGPCANCRKLISDAGAIATNFSVTKAASSTRRKPKATTAAEIKTATDRMAAVNDLPPEGWSNSKEDLNIEYYWGPNGDGTMAAQQVGLTGAEGFMIVSRNNGGDAYMFTASTGQVYLWNMVTDEIYEYINPTDRTAILAQMKMPPGKGQLERKLLFGGDS